MKKLSLNQKIIAMISIFVLSGGIIAFEALLKISEISSSLKHLVHETAEHLMMAETIQTDIYAIRHYEKSMLLENNAEAMQRESAQVEKYENLLRKAVENYQKNASPEDRTELNEFIDHVDAWKKEHQEIKSQAMAGNTPKAIELIHGPAMQSLNQATAIAEKMVNKNEKLMRKEAQESEALAAQSKKLIIIVSVLALITGFAICSFVLKSLNQSINYIISSLSDSSSQVASASGQLAASADELSQSSTTQASALEQTAASIEEMNSMVNKNSDSAANVTHTTRIGEASARKGKETVQQMIHSIADIKASNEKMMGHFQQNNEQLNDIIKVINEIESKTKVINEIVFQTKLLSFNASVEAARAGEHGKGFAVVAEEVGNLAQMSGNAANEISSMLESSIKKVQTIVADTKSSMDSLISEGNQKINVGTKVAEECGTVLEEIVQNIAQINVMAEEISVASSEQAKGVNEITKAINQLDQVTQQNAATSEESASAAEELSAQANTLRESVMLLMETVKGTRNTQPPAKSRPKTEKVIAKKIIHKPTGMPDKVLARIEPVKLPAAVTEQKPVKPLPAKAANDTPAYDDKRFQDV